MHQEQAFSIIGIFIFLPKQKKAEGEGEQAGGRCVCFLGTTVLVRKLVCVRVCTHVSVIAACYH